MRYGRWVLMHPPCSAALMRPLCVRPECPAFLYPGVGAAGYSSQTHSEITAGEAEVRRAAVERVRITGLTIWGAAVTADDQFINHYLLENVTAVLEATLYNIIPTLGADSDVLQTVI